jgi:hypothetical protein
MFTTKKLKLLLIPLKSNNNSTGQIVKRGIENKCTKKHKTSRKTLNNVIKEQKIIRRILSRG